MPLHSHLAGRRSVIFLLLGLAAFILYLWYFVGFDGLLLLLSKLNLYEYTLFFSAAIVALVLSVFFDSLIWHSLLKPLKVKLKLTKVVLYNWIGNFVEMVIPCETVCGEVTRVYLAQRQTGGNAGITAAPVITSRILSTIVYTSGLLIGSLFLLLSGRMPVYLIAPLVLVSVGTIAVIGGVFFLALKEGAADKLVKVLMGLAKIITKNQAKLEKQKEKLQLSLYSFSDAFRTYKKNPKSLVEPAVFAVVAWFFILMVYLFVFRSLNFNDITLVDLAMVYSIASTVETLTAGFPVGVVEITTVNLYSLFGVPLIVAGAATTLTRLLTFWVQILIGYPVLQFTGMKELLKSSQQEIT